MHAAVCALVLLILLSLSPAAVSAGQPDAKSSSTDGTDVAAVDLVRMAAPENFQAFLEPQTTLVDVYYGGRYVIATLATYTPQWIRFHNPDEVIDALPDIIGRLSLLNHLTGDIDTNAGLVCARPGQPLCGRLEPDFIGVIFDETRFRADVFVHPDLRAAPVDRSAEYLPEPVDSDIDLVQGLNVNYSGSSQGEDNYTLFGNSRVGAGLTHGFSDWVARDEDGFTFETLGVQHDLKDHQVKAGLFEPVIPVLRAMRQQPLVGASVGRSFHARTDYSSIIASEIEVFLANQSQVDIFRDGRLYDSKVYESGNQRLDTDRLPPGAYLIDIRITDVGGRTRTLQRFFVKSALLAPAGHDVWFAELGRVMDRVTDQNFPEDGGATIARGGYQHRLNSKAGVGIAGATEGDHLLSELSAIWIEQRFELGGEIFAATDGAAGYGLRGNAMLPTETNMSVNMLRTWPGSTAGNPDEYSLVGDDIMQRNLQFSRDIGPGFATLSASESRANSSETSRIQAAGYTWAMPLSNNDNLTFSARISRQDGDFAGQIAMEWRRQRANWQYFATPRYMFSQRDEDPEGLGFNAGVDWKDGPASIDDIEVNAAVDVDEDQTSTTLRGKHGSQFGEGIVSVSKLDTDTANSVITSASFNTNLAYGQGVIAGGGPQQGDSAVIIDLRGAKGSAFDILIDNQRAFTARGDSRTVVALNPYRTYRILVKDIGTNYVRYDERPQEVTLYPGQVIALDYKLESVMVVIGRLVQPRKVCENSGNCTESMAPLGDVILSGTEGITTVDPDGFFQGEIRTSAGYVEVDREDLRCRAELDLSRVKNGVALVGDAVCRPVTAGQPEGGATTPVGP